MLSIGNISRDPDYYKELSKESYYTAGGTKGIWLGQGAAALGLEGTVDPIAYHHLLYGFFPDGSRSFVQRQKGKTHNFGWDLCWSAPKSLSCLWAVADEPLRRQIEALQFEAVQHAMEYAEAKVAISRCGPGGHRREHVKLIAAAFPHGTSRLQDPALHTHVLVFNVGIRREDGSTGALMGRHFFQHELALGALYRARLSHLLQQELGLAIERSGDSFEVAGVPRDLMRTFSKRRQVIDAYLEAHGLSGGEAAARATIQTRPRKEIVPQEVLFAQWRDVARTHGFTPEHVAALVRGRAPEPGPAEVTPEHGTLPGALDDPAPAIPHEPAALLGHPDLQPEDGISSWSGTPNPEYPVAGSASPLPDAAPRPYRGFEEPIPYLSPNARPGGGFIPPEGTPSLPPLSQRLLDAAVQRALQNATTEHSYFSERDLIRYLARECQWLPPITPFRIWEAAHALLERSPDIVPLGVAKQERVYTTKELLHIEQEMLQKVERSRREESNPTLLIGTTLARWLHPGLNADQREVFQRLTDLQGRIQVLDGITGAGKSQLLHACAQAWKLSGYKVIGIALTSRAARKMEKEIGIASVSLANFLWQVDRSLLRDLAEGLVQAIREEFLGMPRITQEQRYLAVDDRTMIVLDGAHAVGTRLLAPLITIRERANALLTLVGDRAHLPYLAAGGGYAAICDQLHAPRLQQPRRQEREWAQEAVRNAAEGNARQVLQEYAERGLLDVASTRAGAREALVDAWKREGIQRPREHHIFTSTRDDADTLNRMAQKARREAGKLGKIALTVNGYKIHRNDRVLFLKTSRALGLDAGATGTIIALEPITGSLLVRTDDGRFVGVPTLRYHHLSLGYASTTHQARDRVVETAYVLLNGMAQDREVFYTQLSRAEGVTRLFAHTQDNDPALADLVERMEISHAQELGATMLQRQQEHERDYEIAPER